MNIVSEITVRTLLIGTGATLVMDAVAFAANQLFSIPMSDWAMVGRWVGHFPRGKFTHDSMAQATPVRGELVVGWITHYVTGLAYAALLVVIVGVEWMREPTLLPAVLIGVSMLVAPFFVMQPAMGYGVAASRTASPMKARLRSVMNHAAFGFGLYLAAALTANW